MHPRPRASFLSLAILCPLLCQSAGLITTVTQLNGDTDRPDAKFTGQRFDVINGGTTLRTGYTVPSYGENVLAMTDRIHEHNSATADLPLPDYLLGREYILIANNNRDNLSFQLDVGLSERCVVYLLIDNRVGDNNAATPPDFSSLMSWVVRDEWQPVINGLNRTANGEWPDETGYDENGDGSINQYASVYMKVFEAGEVAFSTYEMGQGINMYGLVVDSAVPPSVPTDLAVALNGDGSVKLGWTRAKGATSYSLKRASLPGGPYTTIASDLRDPSYEDTGLANGTTYYYVVSGLNGFGESTDSNEVQARPNVPVTGLSAIGRTSKISLAWNALNGATSYLVKRSGTPGGPYSDVATAVPGTQYEDTGLAGGTVYYYVVLGNLPGGTSGASVEASALTAAGMPSVSIETFSTTGLRVNWTSSDQVVNTFVVEQSADGVNFSEIGRVDSPLRYLIVSDLTPDTVYHFRVQASNDTGSSEFSPGASGRTAATGLYINFAAAAFTDGVSGYPLPGFLNDYGDEFGDRGNGYSYGWDVPNGANARLRNSANSRDRRYDTLNHMQKPQPAGQIWEIEVPAGNYSVRIVGGDPDNVDSVFHYLVEGVLSDRRAPGGGSNFADLTMTVEVTDGRLTIENGPEAANNKLAFIEIQPAVEVRITRAELNAGKLNIEWMGGGVLQSSASLTNPSWQDIATGGSAAIDAQAPAQFFRVVK
ncbi:MAG: fibronectin type III domain-containing protein [Verrucomicrobiales bacterium]|nr:fibronectin type III domain-containing protein [Verrucomicrobiales bacterium]